MAYPTGPPTCGTAADPTCKVRIRSARDWALIIVYAYWGLNILSYAIFLSYKARRLKSNPVQPYIIQQSSKAKAKKTGGEVVPKAEKGEEVRLPLDDLREVRLTGFKLTLFGEYCWYLACLTCAHWIVLWLVLLVDTYNKCQVTGIDGLCFYGNYAIFGTYEFNGTVILLLIISRLIVSMSVCNSTRSRLREGSYRRKVDGDYSSHSFANEHICISV